MADQTSSKCEIGRPGLPRRTATRHTPRHLDLDALRAHAGEYLRLTEIAELVGVGDEAIRRRLGRARRIKVPITHAYSVDDLLVVLERDQYEHRDAPA